MMQRIAVLGAGGHTGRFVVDQLERKGMAVNAATRSGLFVPIDPAGGAGRTCHAIDFATPDSLDRALARADAVINCAGPFLDTVRPAVTAALRAGIPYLDVAAEQRAVQTVFEEFDEAAQTAGVALLPAVAFFGALADLLTSTLVAGLGEVDAIDIAVGLDSWHPTTGTRRTGERNVFERLIVREGRLVPVFPIEAEWAFPSPIGKRRVTCVALSEVILIARHIAARSITSFMNVEPLADLADGRTPAPQAIDPSGRSAQRFVLDVRVTAGDRTLRASASGQDIYAATAPLVVEACLDVLRRPVPLAGAYALGAVVDPQAILSRLAPKIEVAFFPHEQALR